MGWRPLNGTCQQRRGKLGREREQENETDEESCVRILEVETEQGDSKLTSIGYYPS